jgi:predicted Rdx family selenoprotein
MMQVRLPAEFLVNYHTQLTYIRAAVLGQKLLEAFSSHISSIQYEDLHVAKYVKYEKRGTVMDKFGIECSSCI